MDICPQGWHIPSFADWNTLMEFVYPYCGDYNDGCNGVGTNAGWYLKASGWGRAGEDTYGFSALPGGYVGADGSFHNVGDYGYWWSTREDDYDSRNAYICEMNPSNDVNWKLGGKDRLFSVRCLQD